VKVVHYGSVCILSNNVAAQLVNKSLTVIGSLEKLHLCAGLQKASKVTSVQGMLHSLPECSIRDTTRTINECRR